MQQIVINTCFGGFGLSDEQLNWINNQRKQINLPPYEAYWDVPRDDPFLVAVVPMLMPPSPYARLKVVEIPDGVLWKIEEYDGLEHIAEEHQTWG
jgi:hypothetical protein